MPEKETGNAQTGACVDVLPRCYFNVSKIAEFAKSDEPILDEPITLEEKHKALTKLKTGKGAGNDSISNEMIKSSLSIIGPVLQILFNKVLNSGIFPQLWSVGYISPVG